MNNIMVGDTCLAFITSDMTEYTDDIIIQAIEEVRRVRGALLEEQKRLEGYIIEKLKNEGKEKLMFKDSFDKVNIARIITKEYSARKIQHLDINSWYETEL
jgi:hypothetical protein